MKRYWYKDAVIYTLDVRSFKDGNGDGLGDFKGLLEQFDYLVDLGITGLWLLPFFPSEGRDSGYDVTNYLDVDPRLGTLEDFKTLVRKAAEHNIKIIIDLVINHTSDQHPWFQEALKDKSSPYRDYYIWSREKPANDKQDVIFKNVENSNWQYSEQAGEYYYHTFYSFQPDLNIFHPAVLKEVDKIISFWMNAGVSGFRVDAVPHLLRQKGGTEYEGDPFEILNEWKEIVISHFAEGILFGEADVAPEEYASYMEGKRIDGLLNFYCNNYLFYTLATKNPAPLLRAFQRLQVPLPSEFYLNFLRNHDELDLERLTEEERQQVFKVFAPEEDMRLYERGIRRRLPPMIHNDRKLLDLCFSLLLSLPGTPIIRYGEEIGMGDDLRLKERNSVRTAMQWSGEKHGGFTVESPQNQVWPVISGGEYGYERVNVAAQQTDRTSLLHSVKKMIRAREQAIAFRYGTLEPLPTDHEKVMAHFCRCEDYHAFAVHSFCDSAVTVSVHLPSEWRQLFHLILGDFTYAFQGSKLTITLPPYGFGWWVSEENSADDNGS